MYDGTVEVDLPFYWVPGNCNNCTRILAYSQQVAGMLLRYILLCTECTFYCVPKFCRRESLYPPGDLVITIVTGDTIKGTLCISAVIHTAVGIAYDLGILCEVSFFNGICVT